MTAHHEKGQSLVECAALLISIHRRLEQDYLRAESVRESSRHAVYSLGRLATYQIMDPFMSRVAGCLTALALAGFSRTDARDTNVRTAVHNILLLRDVVVEHAVAGLDGDAGVLVRLVMRRQEDLL
ncbi:MAG: hypothetical protein Unbinned3992contig1000_16 [Prokaryotic dsDNA virus sp.]|nr:MAG: hypothetical protein Unbinned3992contig1000_16 [Prokaryotic dsDNA virus sp.]|tara:strand:+ start:4835 stop:5212 length:378 start_codon:yes stop_codon:yes gene_type:complete